MEIGQECLATDRYGNYHNEPCTVVGFKTNMIGLPLVKVRLTDHPSTTAVFYPSELRPK